MRYKNYVPKAPNTSKATSEEETSGERKSIKVTEELIREVMKDAEYSSLQKGGVNIDLIQEYVDAMLNGDKFPAIKVDSSSGNIVDGNHRYIASKITGVPIEIQDATQSISSTPISWDEILIESWGN